MEGLKLDFQHMKKSFLKITLKLSLGLTVLLPEVLSAAASAPNAAASAPNPALKSAAPSTSSSPSGAYRIVRTFSVAGEGRWDCLWADSASNRLFVTHGDGIQVLDASNGKEVGSIPNVRGAHAVAIAPDCRRGFITAGKDTAVVYFDLKTLATLGRIHVEGLNPDIILYEPATKNIFVFNGKSHNAVVVDPAQAKAVGVINLPGKPEFAAADGQGNVYVNLEDSNRVVVLDARALRVTRQWSLAPGEGPSGLAIDAAKGRLFSACDNRLLVISDYRSGKVIGTAPIGSRVDGAEFDSQWRRVYTSNGDGSISVIGEDEKGGYALLSTIPTQAGARTLALNAKTHHLYLPTADFGPTPEATAQEPKPRPALKPGTFRILDVAVTP